MSLNSVFSRRQHLLGKRNNNPLLLYLNDLLHLRGNKDYDLCFIDTTTYLFSFPAEHKQAHCDGGKIFRWARSNENLISTTGRPGTQIKVHQAKTTQVRKLKKCIIKKLFIHWRYYVYIDDSHNRISLETD